MRELGRDLSSASTCSTAQGAGGGVERRGTEGQQLERGAVGGTGLGKNQAPAGFVACRRCCSHALPHTPQGLPPDT